MNRSMKIDNVTKEFEKTDAIVDTIKYVENLQIKKDINEDDENGFLTKYNIRDNKDLENDFGVYDDVDLDEINPYADRLIEYDEEDKLFDSNSLKSSSNVVIPKDVKFNSKLYEGIECQNNRNKDDGSNKPFKHLNNSESKDEAQFENEKLSNKSLSQLEILNDEFRHHEALIDFEIPKGKEKKESESSKNFKFVDEIDYDIEKLDDENQEKVMRLCKAFPRINQKAIIIEFYNNYLDSDSTYVALQDINAD
ncbi:hypothetical protein A3Q56_07847 [Intoshia linei]|uniref:Uncharacterized protein n=1 Tax=Intoshia linei TaxID=1819745 RepID=A0A177ASU4_9BILA|nr:hypothetical protein A3Q56_07847 [Intoshia linei]